MFWSNLLSRLQQNRKHLTIFAVLAIVVVGVFFVYSDVYALDVAKTIIDEVTKLVYKIVGWLLALILGFLANVMELVVRGILYFANWSEFIDVKIVTIGWRIVRDIFNSFFIIMLLVSAFSTIFNYQKYHYRAILPKLFLAAILINFSKFICGIMIDVSQIMTLSFARELAGAPGGVVTLLGLEALVKLGGNGAVDNIKVVVGLLYGVVFMLIALFMLVWMLIMLVFRVVMLWILVILSPANFFLGAIGSGRSAEWWKEFTAQLITGPVLIFFIWLAFVSYGQSQGALNAEIARIEERASLAVKNLKNDRVREAVGVSANKDISAAASKAMTPESFFSMIVALAIMFAGIKITRESSAMGAQAAHGFAKSGFRRAGRAGKGAAGFIASRSLGAVTGKTAADLRSAPLRTLGGGAYNALATVTGARLLRSVGNRAAGGARAGFRAGTGAVGQGKLGTAAGLAAGAGAALGAGALGSFASALRPLRDIGRSWVAADAKARQEKVDGIKKDFTEKNYSDNALKDIIQNRTTATKEEKLAASQALAEKGKLDSPELMKLVRGMFQGKKVAGVTFGNELEAVKQSFEEQAVKNNPMEYHFANANTPEEKDEAAKAMAADANKGKFDFTKISGDAISKNAESFGMFIDQMNELKGEGWVSGRLAGAYKDNGSDWQKGLDDALQFRTAKAVDSKEEGKEKDARAMHANITGKLDVAFGDIKVADRGAAGQILKVDVNSSPDGVNSSLLNEYLDENKGRVLDKVSGNVLENKTVRMAVANSVNPGSVANMVNRGKGPANLNDAYVKGSADLLEPKERRLRDTKQEIEPLQQRLTESEEPGASALPGYREFSPDEASKLSDLKSKKYQLEKDMKDLGKRTSAYKRAVPDNFDAGDAVQ